MKVNDLACASSFQATVHFLQMTLICNYLKDIKTLLQTNKKWAW